MSSVFRSSILQRCLRVQTLNIYKSLTIRYRSITPVKLTRTIQSFPALRSYTSTSTSEDCPGCGAPFQVIDSEKPGFFVPTTAAPKKNKKQGKNSLSNDEYQAILANLDDETRDLLGTTTLARTEKTTEKRVICQRCYRLQHYNKSTTESTPEFLRSSQQYGSLQFLKTKQDPLIVAVCDVTDLPGSLGDLPQLLSNNSGARIHLAMNKVDILPESARRHEQRIRDWVVQHVKSLGLNTAQIASVNLISAEKGWGITGLMHRLMDSKRPTDDIYMIGCTNVGKSALVNKFMSQIRGNLDREGRLFKKELKNKYQITSSAIPGTTMGTIKIPLRVLGMMSDNSGEDWEKRRLVIRERYLIDTPGVINENQLIHQLPFADQKKIVNQTELNPVTFKLEPGKSLLLKPLVRIDLLESSNTVLFTTFSSLMPHITRTEKLPPAYALEYKAHNRPVKDTDILRSDLLVPIEETVRVSNSHSSYACVDFSFAGIGWVSLTGLFENAKFRIWIPKGLDPSKVFKLRDPPLLPYEFKGSIRKFYGSGERTNK